MSSTSVLTSSVCTKDMAQVGGVYVSSVVYSVMPLPETSNMDLTRPTGNGVTFTAIPNTIGILDEKHQPIYNIKFTFNPAGVDSLSSIIVNAESNVNKFFVEFFTPSNPNEVFTSLPDTPLVLTSTMDHGQASIIDFPSQVPSPLSGIRISILSTTDNQ